MRLAVGKFLDANKEFIYNVENNMIIDFLLHPAYKKGKMFNMSGFIEENIFSMHNEAEQIVFYLAPIIFNINVELYVLEGSMNNDPTKARFMKEIIYCQDENNHEKVTILYRFTQYDVLYSKDWYTSNKDIIDILETTEVSKSKLRIKEVSTVVCEICEKESKSVELVDESSLTSCKDCLQIYIRKKMTERVRNYIAENYNNFECKKNINLVYCRPLNLNDDKALSDEDFLILNGKTITQYLIYILEGLCESCVKETQQSDFKILECNCRICKNCLIRKIKLATDDLVVYNTYEQSMIESKFRVYKN